MLANARIRELEGNLEKARTTAQYWKDCHLAGNTKIRELEMQLENCRLDAEGVSVYIKEAKEAKAKLRQLCELIERNSKDLQSKFSRLVDDHFRELV